MGGVNVKKYMPEELGSLAREGEERMFRMNSLRHQIESISDALKAMEKRVGKPGADDAIAALNSELKTKKTELEKLESIKY